MANVGIYKTKYETSDTTDELGKIHIFLLFVSGIIWGFLAVNNVDTPDIFKISLVYAILLILGLVGIGMDRGSKISLGIDSALWNSSKLRNQLVFSAVFSLAWIIIFINRGLFLAIPLSVASPTFVVGATTRFFLVTVLGPIAENVFFFAVINFTLRLFIRQILEENNTTKSIVLSVIIFSSQALFADVPYSGILLSAAAAMIAFVSVTKQKGMYETISIIASAIIVGGAMFPVYHSRAYALSEKNFLAATIFGILMCIIASYVGLLPVDIIHTINNTIALGT